MKFFGRQARTCAAPVAPARERGLKFRLVSIRNIIKTVAPARERGLKFCIGLNCLYIALVAPARERGLKSSLSSLTRTYPKSRSREGAWIEIPPHTAMRISFLVAPARERGLKF